MFREDYLMKLARLSFLVLTGGLLLLTGCGEGEAPSSESTPSPESTPAVASEPIGSAMVTGMVHFDGVAPDSRRLRLDQDCSALHDGPVMSNAVIVNDGMLKNVFVYVKEGLGDREFAPPSEPVLFDQSGCMYEPHVFGIQVGQTLKILNSDPFLHNINGQAEENRPFNFGMPNQGDERERTFRVPEVMLRIKCDVHPWMGAWAGVLTHPFFDVSGDDGQFSIEGLPAGDYVVEAWHEEFGTQTQSVTLTDGGTASLIFTFSGSGSTD